MSRDHWDAIIASAPLNATASKVTSKGVHFVPERQFTDRLWDEPPAMKPLPRMGTILDLRGFKNGRLTVLGLLAESRKSNAAWVCRCSCGAYTTRTAKGLRSPTNTSDMCARCRYTQQLREAASGNNARKRAESEQARKWKPADAA